MSAESVKLSDTSLLEVTSTNRGAQVEKHGGFKNVQRKVEFSDPKPSNTKCRTSIPLRYEGTIADTVHISAKRPLKVAASMK